jgi:hypothetical protein
MIRHRSLLGAAAVALAIAAPVTDALGATDGPPTITSGWWSRLHQGDVDMTAADPGAPPPDGLAVASAPDGATAIAALRFVLDDGEGAPVLTLRVAGTPTNGDAAEAIILACHSGAAWTAGAAQDWDSKPPAGCDPAAGGGSVTGQRGDDGRSWTFPLGPLQLDRVVDVVLVPAVAADATVSPTFQVSFEPPTGGDLVTEASGAAPAVTLPPTVAPTSGTARPVTASPARVPVSPTFVAALPAAAQVVTATAPIRREATPLQAIAAVAERTTPGWVRALAGLQVLVAASIGWLLLRSGSDDQDDGRRGLGPFVRPRIGEAPRL